jgi:hypothetical protein
MNTSKANRATFVEVFGSIKFDEKREKPTTGHWPNTGFAVNKSTHNGTATSEDHKQAVRSSN